MPFKPEQVQFTSVNPSLLNNHNFITQRPYSQIKSNFNYTKSNYTDFKVLKTAHPKEKDWSNQMKNSQVELIISQVGKTIEKPKTASLEDQRRNNIPNNAAKEQNLAKTVKPRNFSYKKSHPQIGPEGVEHQFVYLSEKQKQKQKIDLETKIIHQIEKHQSNKIRVETATCSYFEKPKQAQQKPLIMSIDQIHQVQKKELHDKVIHKITSSASRLKLKTSSSKDSKGSLNNQRQSINSTTERYNKYINQGLININIDLRKQVPSNMVVPNLNVRKIGTNQQNHYNLKFFTPQQDFLNREVFDKIITTPRNINSFESKYSQSNGQLEDIKFFEKQSLTCRKSIPRQDTHLALKGKNRSKSNLSKYSQLKENPYKQCLINCIENLPQQQTNNLKHLQTQKKSQKQIQTQKAQKKIHLLSYSATKNRKQIFNQNTNNLSVNQINADQKYQTQKTQKTRSQNTKSQFLIEGLSLIQQKKMSGAQTDRRYSERSSFTKPFALCQPSGLQSLIEEKMIRKPIRLTFQKRS